MLCWLLELVVFFEFKGCCVELDVLLCKVDFDYWFGVEWVNVVVVEVLSGWVVQLFEGCQVVGILLLWVVFVMCMLMSYGFNIWLLKLMVGGGYVFGLSLVFFVILNVGVIFGVLFGGWLVDCFGVGCILVLFFVLVVVFLVVFGLGLGFWLFNGLLVVVGVIIIGILVVIYVYVVQFYLVWVCFIGVGWVVGVGCFGVIVGLMFGGSLLVLELLFQQNFLVFVVFGVIGVLVIVCIYLWLCVLVEVFVDVMVKKFL